MQFDFTKDYILENNRVSLRPLVKGDYHNLKEISNNEPELWKYSLIDGNGKENLKNYIDLAIKAREDEKAYPFIIFDKLKKKYAGSTRFYDFQSTHKTILLGYTWYGKEFQRTGLNQNCKYLMLEFAFDTLKLERVEFRADNKNEQSINAMKNLGCTYEGVLRSNLIGLNGRRDSIVFSILKEEWDSSIRPELLKKITT